MHALITESTYILVLVLSYFSVHCHKNITHMQVHKQQRNPRYTDIYFFGESTIANKIKTKSSNFFQVYIS